MLLNIFKFNKMNNSQKLTPSRVALLGMLLALMIALKYAFGFLAGIEFITFMFIFLGIFLPVLDLFLLIFCFNFLIAIIYGFGFWWFAYWIIWTSDAFISKVLSKVTKNRFVFGAWGFLAGFFVFFWYFISDWIFYDVSYALLNVITAIPINLIEGLTTMLTIILFAPIMSRIFKVYEVKFWNKKTAWQFREIKNKNLNIASITFVVLFSLVGITFLFIYNQWFFDLKDHFTTVNYDLLGNGDTSDFAPSEKIIMFHYRII